jgi:hypothetical protein
LLQAIEGKRKKLFKQSKYFCDAKTGMTEKKKTKTSIVVDREQWEEFKEEAARQGSEVSEKLNELIARYLDERYTNPKPGGAKEPDDYTPEELHALLDEVLKDGTQHISAISQNLELLAFALRFIGAHSPEEIRKLRKRLSAITPKPKK